MKVVLLNSLKLHERTWYGCMANIMLSDAHFYWRYSVLSYRQTFPLMKHWQWYVHWKTQWVVSAECLMSQCLFPSTATTPDTWQWNMQWLPWTAKKALNKLNVIVFIHFRSVLNGNFIENQAMDRQRQWILQFAHTSMTQETGLSFMIDVQMTW